MTNVMGVFRDYSNTPNNDAKNRYVSCVRKMGNSVLFEETEVSNKVGDLDTNDKVLLQMISEALCLRL
jgi:hypothetical protein